MPALSVQACSLPRTPIPCTGFTQHPGCVSPPSDPVAHPSHVPVTSHLRRSSLFVLSSAPGCARVSIYVRASAHACTRRSTRPCITLVPSSACTQHPGRVLPHALVSHILGCTSCLALIRH